MAAQVPSQSASTKAITVHGIVLTSSDSKPIEGAAVHLSAGNTGARTATTDQEGRFAFADVPPVFITASARKAGYLCDQWLRISPHPNCVRQIDPRGHDVEMTLTMLPEAVVTGRVLTQSGRPVSSIGVALFRKGIQDGRYVWNFAVAAKTGDDGAYRIGSLEPGSYLVRSAAMADVHTPFGRDYGYEATWFPGFSAQDRAQPIVLQAGVQKKADFSVKESLVLINLPYTWNLPDEEGAELYGMSGGAPNDQVRPMVVHPGHLLQVYAPEGHYTFSLCIDPPSPGGRRQPWSNGTIQPYCGSSEFNIEKYTMSAPTMHLQQPVSIPVHVRAKFGTQPHDDQATTGHSPPGVLFRLESPNSRSGKVLNWSSVQPEELAFTDVSPGTYIVRASGASGAYVASLTCDKLDLLRDPLVVGAGIPACAINASVRDDFALVKVGVSPQTIPVMTAAGVRLTAAAFIPLDEPLREAPGTTLPFGAPLMGVNLPPGRYLALISDSLLAWNEPDVRAHLMTLGKVVTLKPRQTQTVLLDWSSELHDPQSPLLMPQLGTLGP
jgi:hypothetical protein